MGEVVKKLCKDFQVKIVHGRPHHPQPQGQVENLNKQVKKLIARFLQRLPRELQPNVWPLLLAAIAEFKKGDEIIFRCPVTELSHFSKNDPFKPLNDIGVIKEVLLGGIYKVEVTQEEKIVLMSIFSCQMVHFTTNQPDQPEDVSTTELSLMNVLIWSG